MKKVDWISKALFTYLTITPRFFLSLRLYSIASFVAKPRKSASFFFPGAALKFLSYKDLYQNDRFPVFSF